jgi:hypothetical protein
MLFRSTKPRRLEHRPDDGADLALDGHFVAARIRRRVASDAPCRAGRAVSLEKGCAHQQPEYRASVIAAAGLALSLVL